MCSQKIVLEKKGAPIRQVAQVFADTRHFISLIVDRPKRHCQAQYTPCMQMQFSSHQILCFLVEGPRLSKAVL